MNPQTPTRYTIAANLNYDMLGSPNYMRQLYTGESCPEQARNGCGVLEGRFSKYFLDQGLVVVRTLFLFFLVHSRERTLMGLVLLTCPPPPLYGRDAALPLWLLSLVVVLYTLWNV